MIKVKQLDFTGTTIFCSLDVHKVSWRVNLRDTELELKDFTQPADAVVLLQTSRKKIKDFSKPSYVCGPDKMVSDTSKILRELGADADLWFLKSEAYTRTRPI